MVKLNTLILEENCKALSSYPKARRVAMQLLCESNFKLFLFKSATNWLVEIDNVMQLYFCSCSPRQTNTVKRLKQFCSSDIVLLTNTSLFIQVWFFFMIEYLSNYQSQCDVFQPVPLLVHKPDFQLFVIVNWPYRKLFVPVSFKNVYLVTVSSTNMLLKILRHDFASCDKIIILLITKLNIKFANPLSSNKYYCMLL